MPINAHPEFLAAEKEYVLAQTLDEKIEKLRKMISHAPAHKGGENLRAQLKTRLKKFLEKKEKAKKSGKSTQQGIKKESMQAAIIGNANAGKSTILSLLTKAKPKISETRFTTTYPQIGMMNYASTSIQLIENPAIESEFYNKGVTHTADTLLIIITSLEQLKKIKEKIKKNSSKKIIIFNKTNQTQKELRKIEETFKTKKINYVIFDKKNIEELKEKIFQSFDKIRVYTKEPGKEKSQRPIILRPNSTVKDVAEKILKGFSQKVKQTKIWGPSSKFSGQIVGLRHKLKDLDTVEFKTG
jgi:ribosome-interacting GTPase 1